MGFWRKHKPQTFDAWLDQATRGLCDFAKTQVREEYEDHYRGAYEDLREEGLDEHEAAETAVQSLGDAREVRKQIRKIYLTWLEEKHLGWIASSREGIRSNRTSVPQSVTSRNAILAWQVAESGIFGAVFGGMLWGFQGTILGAVGVLTVILLRREYYAQVTIHAATVEDLTDKCAQRRVADLCDVFWVLSLIFVFASRASYPFMVISACLAVVLVSKPIYEILRFRVIARKLRRYPAQNATPVVVKLREAYRDAAKSEAGQ